MALSVHPSFSLAGRRYALRLRENLKKMFQRPSRIFPSCRMYTSMVGEKQSWKGAQQQVGTFFTGCRGKSNRSKHLRGMEGLLEAIIQLLPYKVITQFLNQYIYTEAAFIITLLHCHQLVHPFLTFSTPRRTSRVFPHDILSLPLKKSREGMIPWDCDCLHKWKWFCLGPESLGERERKRLRKGRKRITKWGTKEGNERARGQEQTNVTQGNQLKIEKQCFKTPRM